MLDREVYAYAEVDKLIGLAGTAKRWINGYERGGKITRRSSAYAGSYAVGYVGGESRLACLLNTATAGKCHYAAARSD